LLASQLFGFGEVRRLVTSSGADIIVECRRALIIDSVEPRRQILDMVQRGLVYVCGVCVMVVVWQSEAFDIALHCSAAWKFRNDRCIDAITL